DAEQDEVSWRNHPPEIETSTDRWLNRRNISALPAAAMVCKFVRHRGWGRLRLKCFKIAPVNPVRTWLSPFFLLVSLAECHWSLVEMFGQKKKKKKSVIPYIHANCDSNGPAHPARPESGVMD
ncbi:hypothetical protein CMEL01_01006, partial [Colletotrichum melonis]